MSARRPPLRVQNKKEAYQMNDKEGEPAKANYLTVFQPWL